MKNDLPLTDDVGKRNPYVVILHLVVGVRSSITQDMSSPLNDIPRRISWNKDNRETAMNRRVVSEFSPHHHCKQ